MTLDNDDLQAIRNILRELQHETKVQDTTTDDMAYLASLTPAERKAELKKRRMQC